MAVAYGLSTLEDRTRMNKSPQRRYGDKNSHFGRHLIDAA